MTSTLYLHWFNQGTNHLGTKLHHLQELKKIVLDKKSYNFEENFLRGATAYILRQILAELSASVL